MRLIGKDKLINFFRDPNSTSWVSCWADDVINSQWGCSSDLLTSFPRARKIDDRNFVFPVLSGEVSVQVVVCFNRRTVCISKLLIDETKL
jgi:mRNA-degrading endonuclease HigB of HigAB toxin-antitoxin module